MAHRIDFLAKFTASNADALAGSSLDPIPRNGYARIYASEIVDTATIEIDPALHPNPTGTGGQHVPEGAGAESGAAPNHPIINAFQPHWETEVLQGEKLSIRLAGTVSELLLWVTLFTR